ncbi:hypothetical protein BCV72DRAFT_122735 [Rhizopus microsporus var. microsporus]|uniref:Uncharacterized protein n=1 Tax=Rhizopus microsporus var. microsporus TaxID=86635 RepID=A0A1X0RGL5_RHIZD|nr:hypothetical protein BCV72DRAFT_122735 [Rhizopus microsporus var. microsporus]
MSRSDTNMQHDLQLLDEKIRQIKQELQYCEEHLNTIQNFLSTKSVNSPKVIIPVSITTNTTITPATTPTTPSKGSTIPPFSLWDISMLKHIPQEEVDQGNTFLTIYDFIEKFESTLAFYRVDLDASWFQYLAASVHKGGDQKIIKWFEQAFSLEPALKMARWKEIREKLILLWDITLDLQKSRQQFVSIKQTIGEPAYKYFNRFMNAWKKAMIPDGPILVHFFIQSIQVPLKMLIKSCLSEALQGQGYLEGPYSAVNDSLSSLQSLLEKKKDYLDAVSIQLFQSQQEKQKGLELLEMDHDRIHPVETRTIAPTVPIPDVTLAYNSYTIPPRAPASALPLSDRRIAGSSSLSMIKKDTLNMIPSMNKPVATTQISMVHKDLLSKVTMVRKDLTTKVTMVHKDTSNQFSMIKSLSSSQKRMRQDELDHVKRRKAEPENCRHCGFDPSQGHLEDCAELQMIRSIHRNACGSHVEIKVEQGFIKGFKDIPSGPILPEEYAEYMMPVSLKKKKQAKAKANASSDTKNTSVPKLKERMIEPAEVQKIKTERTVPKLKGRTIEPPEPLTVKQKERTFELSEAAKSGQKERATEPMPPKQSQKSNSSSESSSPKQKKSVELASEPMSPEQDQTSALILPKQEEEPTAEATTPDQKGKADESASESVMINMFRDILKKVESEYGLSKNT